MEDIFQYLIWFFIIISAISSLFRKKEEPKPPARREEPVHDSSTSTQVEAEGYDFTTELDKLFRKSESEIKKEEEFSRRDEFQIAYDESVSDEDNAVPSEHVSYEASRKEIESTVPSWKQSKEWTESEITANKLESLDIRRNEIRNEFLDGLRRRFTEPATLKEAVILSEIIGKPKALS